MLVLSRQRDETIMIGDEVTCTVLAVKGNHVRVGINAPPHIAVHREEIYKRIKGEQAQAQAQPPKPSGGGSGTVKLVRDPALADETTAPV